MWRHCPSIQIRIYYTSNSCPTDRSRLYQIDFHICRKSRGMAWCTWHLFGVAPLILFGPQNSVGGLQKWQRGTQNTVDELEKVDSWYNVNMMHRGRASPHLGKTSRIGLLLPFDAWLAYSAVCKRFLQLFGQSVGPRASLHCGLGLLDQSVGRLNFRRSIQ